jgi:hypothetical protein
MKSKKTFNVHLSYTQHVTLYIAATSKAEAERNAIKLVATGTGEYELENGCDNLIAEAAQVQDSKEYDEALEKNSVALSEINDLD